MPAHFSPAVRTLQSASQAVESGTLWAFTTLSDDSKEARAKQLYQQGTDLGLKDVQLASYSVLLSLTGPSPSSIVHWDSHQCFVLSGAQYDPRNHNNNNPTADQHFSYAAYSAHLPCCIL
ncbi:unnamed protein product [Coregonus sp. 'balchen']|nr:unnamed protein product [Coregonus sp. 'balchen']